jgi:hypothetical protein
MMMARSEVGDKAVVCLGPGSKMAGGGDGTMCLG